VNESRLPLCWNFVFSFSLLPPSPSLFPLAPLPPLTCQNCCE
jgi:hypothetical protein